MLLVMAACSPDSGELLESIPASSQYVACININDVAKNLGVKISDQTVTLPNDLRAPLARVNDDMLAEAARVAKAIDLDCIVVFGQLDDDAIITFRIADTDLFANLRQDSHTSKANGFEISALGGGLSLASRGTQGWILRSSKPAEELSTLLKEAKESNITKYNGIGQLLEANHAARIAVNTSGQSGNSAQWTTAGIDITNQKIAANIAIMEADGKPVKFEGLQTLSTDFLSYTPAQCNFVFALGATPDTDWSYFNRAVALIPDAQLQGLFDTLSPYFAKADGTVAMAATVDVNDLSASGSTFLLMVHMPQADIESALTDVEERIRAAGATPHRAPDGSISAGGGNMALYAAPINGSLAISTLPLTPTRENELNPYFLSRKAALVLNVGELPIITPPTSATLSADVQSEQAQIAISSPRSIASILGMLISLVI